MLKQTATVALASAAGMAYAAPIQVNFVNNENSWSFDGSTLSGSSVDGSSGTASGVDTGDIAVYEGAGGDAGLFVSYSMDIADNGDGSFDASNGVLTLQDVDGDSVVYSFSGTWMSSPSDDPVFQLLGVDSAAAVFINGDGMWNGNDGDDDDDDDSNDSGSVDMSAFASSIGADIFDSLSMQFGSGTFPSSGGSGNDMLITSSVAIPTPISAGLAGLGLGAVTLRRRR